MVTALVFYTFIALPFDTLDPDTFVLLDVGMGGNAGSRPREPAQP